MNKTMYSLSTAIFLFVLLLLSSPLNAGQKVTFAFEDKNNFPYYIGNGLQVHWKKPGVSVELLKMLESKLDVKVVMKRMPWNRCKHDLKNGKVDGIFNASFKAKRMKLGVYPTKNGITDPEKRITTIAYALYKIKGSSLTWDFEKKKFTGLRLGIAAPLGYSIVSDLTKWGAKVSEAATTHENFMMLTYGRVEGAAALQLAGDYYLMQKEFTDIVKVKDPLVSKAYYLMLSHQFVEKDPHLAKLVWNAVEEIRKESLDKISEKYFKDSSKDIVLSFKDGGGWPPYVIENTDGSYKGIMVDIFSQAGKALGYNVKFKPLPGTSIAKFMKTGDVHARPKAMDWVDNPEEYYWTDPVVESADHFITKKDSTITGIQDIKNKCVITHAAYGYPTLDHLFDKGEIKKFDCFSEKEMLHNLLAGNCPAAVMNKNVALWLANKDDELRGKIKTIKVPVATSAYRFQFIKTPEMEIFVPKFNAELAKMKKNGTLSKIINSYVR